MISSITSHLLRFHKRREPGRFAVDINLPFCKDYIDSAKRLTANTVNEAAVNVLSDLRSTIADNIGIISGHQRYMRNDIFHSDYKIDGEITINIGYFWNKLHLEVHSGSVPLEGIRQVLNDFTLKQSYGLSAEDVIKNYLSAETKGGKLKFVKIMSSLLDERFNGVLRHILLNEKKVSVCREALKSLGNMDYRERNYDLQQSLGIQDPAKIINSIAAAFLYGNRFLAAHAESYPLSKVVMEHDAGRNPLVGVGAGDMIGLPLEYYSREEIVDAFGGPVEGPVIPSKPNYFYGQYSDDAELSLMIRDAIDKEHGFIPQNFAGFLAEHAYEIDTMGIPNNGYGFNTLQAARRLYNGRRLDESGGDYSTCGPAIRVIPLAMYYKDDYSSLEEAIVASAKITHNNKTAIAGAIAVGFMSSALLVNDEKFNPNSAQDWLLSKVSDHDQELSDRLKLAFKLARNKSAAVETAYEKLGNSSKTLEVVPLAFYSFLRTPRDFRAAVLTAVNAGGDADSLGSIAGGLSTSHNSEAAIPSLWLRHLKDRHLLYTPLPH